MFGLHFTTGDIFAMLVMAQVLVLLVAAHLIWLFRQGRILRSSALGIPARIGLFFLVAVTPLVGFYAERAFRWWHSDRHQFLPGRAIAMSGLGVVAIVLATIIRETQYAPGFRDWSHTLQMLSGLALGYILLHAILFMAASLMTRASGSVWSTRLHIVSSVLLLIVVAAGRWW